MPETHARPYRVTWTDKATGRTKTLAFRYPIPAEQEVEMLKAEGHTNVNVIDLTNPRKR